MGVRAGKSDRSLISISLVTLIVIGLLIYVDSGVRTLSLLLIGVGLGAVFWTVQFGFSSGWRRWLTVGDTSPILTHLLLLGLVTAFVLPTLGYVSGARGAVAPLAFSLPLGSCLFGIGMQLLPFFVIGSLIGSFLLPSALELGGYEAVVIGSGMGNVTVTLLNLIIIGAVAAVIYILGRYKGVHVSISNGLIFGTIGIAILCWLCVVISGHPWGVTFGFTLWGAKIWQSLGGDLSSFAFWGWPGPARALENSVLADVSSIMDIGMLLGALLFSSCLGRSEKSAWPGSRELFAAVLGGLMMGIGARLAFGCNIGAFLGGVASGSLHGWIWFIFAMIGSWVGVHMRPRFGMSQ